MSQPRGNVDEKGGFCGQKTRVGLSFMGFLVLVERTPHTTKDFDQKTNNELTDARHPAPRSMHHAVRIQSTPTHHPPTRPLATKNRLNFIFKSAPVLASCLAEASQVDICLLIPKSLQQEHFSTCYPLIILLSSLFAFLQQWWCSPVF